jgi:peptidyl-prolyl cis-trans isomerase D
MLAFARKKASKWLAVTLLGLVLVAMVVTGFGTGGFGGIDSMVGGGVGGSDVAKVEGRAITEQELSDTITRQYAQAHERQPQLDLATFLGPNGFEQVLRQLIVGAAVHAFGEDQGLSVSRRMIDREIVNIPGFRNVAGQFDENAMRAALRQQNVTEAQLRDDIAQSLMQRQLLGPIALGAHVPDGVTRAYADLLLERRQGAIGVVPTALFAAGINPTDQQVAAYYNGHRARFTVPERRVIQYAVIGRDQLAASARATDQEIQAYYRDHSDTYGAHETRDLEQVVLPTEQAAQAFAQRVRGGTAFADAAGQAGFAVGDITFANQNEAQFGQATSSEIAQAAFNAARGAILGPTRSDFGYHVVHVKAINRSAARPLDSVRAEIAAAIERSKAQDALGDLVSRIEDQISNGANIEEIAREQHLQLVTTPPLTAAGQSPDQPAFIVSADLRPLLQSAFEMEAEQPEPVVEPIQENQRYALLGIERTIPAAPPPLARIRDQVRAATIQDMALARARTAAQQIVARIGQGSTAAQAFAAAEPHRPAPRDVDMRRTAAGSAPGEARPALLALFSLAQGHARIVAAPNNAGWYVVWHRQRTPGDASHEPQLVQATQREFASSASGEIAQQFARAVQLQSDIRRNDEAIAAVRSRLLSNVAE